VRYQDELFQQRETLLLDTALSLFRDSGWERVTIAQLAQHAGVAKGTVYKHFSSKESIYARLALRFSRDCLAHYRALEPAGTPLKSIRRVLHEAFALMQAHPVDVQLCLHCDRPELQARLGEDERAAMEALDRDYQVLFHELVRAAIEAGEVPDKPIEGLFWGVDAIFQGVMERIAAGGLGPERHGTPSLEAYFEHVVEFIVAGLTGPDPVQGREVAQ
jgi:AcrR family transcriptional regulator